jgi:predicted Abi (CAAX) family protease
MLLTHPAVDGVAPGAARLAAAAALPLALFVGYHLVNPQEHARRTFWDARFLALAGAPGQVQSCDGLRHLTLLCRACMMAPSPSQPAPGSTSVMAHTRGCAGVLGAACTGAYHATGGSLAAAAVTHWLPVNAWLLLLGGYAKTRGSLKPAPASKKRR